MTFRNPNPLNLIPTLTLTQSLTKALPETLTLTRYLTNFLIWTYHVTRQFFANISPGEHFNPMSWGVIRNQRSKIHRLELVSTARGPSRKILKVDCRVI